MFRLLDLLKYILIVSWMQRREKGVDITIPW